MDVSFLQKKRKTKKINEQPAVARRDRRGYSPLYYNDPFDVQLINF